MNFEDLHKLNDDEPPKSNPNAWLISLADLISLILAFFVLMYSTKDISQEKYNEIKESFANYIHGIKPEKIYKFVERPTGETRIIKKATNIIYIENLIKNSLNDNQNLNVKVSSTENTVKLEFSEDYKNIKELSEKLENKLLVLSKTLSPLSNQLEVVTATDDIKSSINLSDLVSSKLEEFGYDYKIFRTMPDKILTENIDKNKNTVNISIIINSYEYIF